MLKSGINIIHRSLPYKGRESKAIKNALHYKGSYKTPVDGTPAQVALAAAREFNYVKEYEQSLRNISKRLVKEDSNEKNGRDRNIPGYIRIFNDYQKAINNLRDNVSSLTFATRQELSQDQDLQLKEGSWQQGLEIKAALIDVNGNEVIKFFPLNTGSKFAGTIANTIGVENILFGSFATSMGSGYWEDIVGFQVKEMTLGYMKGFDPKSKKMRAADEETRKAARKEKAKIARRKRYAKKKAKVEVNVEQVPVSASVSIQPPPISFIDEPIRSKAPKFRVSNATQQFFPYLNNSGIPLEMYQIYTVETQEEQPDQENIACLMFSLKDSVSVDELKAIASSLKFTGRTVPLSKMPEIAKILKRRIEIRTYDKIQGKTTKRHVYGKEFTGKPIILASYENHLFKYEMTKYTSCFVNNMDFIVDYCTKNNLPINYLASSVTSDGQIITEKSRPQLSSLRLVSMLHGLGKFTEYGVVQKPCGNFLRSASIGMVDDDQKDAQKANRDVLQYEQDCKNIESATDNNIFAKVIEPFRIRENAKLLEEYKDDRKKYKFLADKVWACPETKDEFKMWLHDRMKTSTFYKVDHNEIHMFADCEADITNPKHEMTLCRWSTMLPNGSNYQKTVVYRNSAEEFANTLSSELVATCRKFKGFKSVSEVQKDREDEEKKNENKKGKKDKKESAAKQTHKVVIWFHNAKYDSSLFTEFFPRVSEVEKDGALYAARYMLKFGIVVEFRDTYKHFSCKLSELSDMFKLNVRKGEAVNYHHHTKINVSSNRLTCVDEYAKGLKDGDKEVLLDILRKDSSYEFNEQERKFNATKYYLSYLESDVDVLQQSMIKYREMMYELTHLDVWDSLTCSSFANKYATSQGCFEGSFQVKGGLRDFMQGAVRGGRVFVGEESRVKIDGQHSAVRETDQLTQALDANSLYPSAIERLCNEYGIPVGMAKVGTEQTYEYYQSKDWYTVKIRVLAIRKSQPVPCISVTRNVVIDGKPTTRVQYINELPDGPTEFTVDKITLEDWVKYHAISFTIIEGVFWDEGYNKKLGELVLKLHNLRCKYKKTNEAMSSMIKLVANSIFGKTTQRASETTTVFQPLDTYEQYVYNNFGLIESYELTKFNCKITLRNFDTSFNLNFIGSAILSMSKRIMNEVFSTMGELKIPMLYSDTDSLHCFASDVKPLSEAFLKKYGRTLEGDGLSQFKCDFKLVVNGKKMKDVVSVRNIIIASKVYMDILRGVDDNGVFHYGTHYRVKGATYSGVVHEIERRMALKNMSSITATLDLYRDLKNGLNFGCVMNPGLHCPKFEFINGCVYTRNPGWIRNIKIAVDACELPRETDNLPWDAELSVVSEVFPMLPSLTIETSIPSVKNTIVPSVPSTSHRGGFSDDDDFVSDDDDSVQLTQSKILQPIVEESDGESYDESISESPILCVFQKRISDYQEIFEMSKESNNSVVQREVKRVRSELVDDMENDPDVDDETYDTLMNRIESIENGKDLTEKVSFDIESMEYCTGKAGEIINGKLPYFLNDGSNDVYVPSCQTRKIYEFLEKRGLQAMKVLLYKGYGQMVYHGESTSENFKNFYDDTYEFDNCHMGCKIDLDDYYQIIASFLGDDEVAYCRFRLLCRSANAGDTPRKIPDVNNPGKLITVVSDRMQRLMEIYFGEDNFPCNPYVTEKMLKTMEPVVRQVFNKLFSKLLSSINKQL
jgi:hypothetical protein